MADMSRSTPLGGPELDSEHTPVARAFDAFLDLLRFSIAAERDIEGMPYRDTAYDHWLRESELAWERTSGEARSVCETAAKHPSDAPLQQTAMLVRHALGSESRDEFRSIRSMVDAQPRTFLTARTDVRSRRSNRMVRDAIGLLDQVGQLAMISDSPDPLDLDLSDWAA